MAVGFNVGSTISLGDIELALDYMNNEELFMPDIAEIVAAKKQNHTTEQLKTAGDEELEGIEIDLEDYGAEDDDDTLTGEDDGVLPGDDEDVFTLEDDDDTLTGEDDEESLFEDDEEESDGMLFEESDEDDDDTDDEAEEQNSPPHIETKPIAVAAPVAKQTSNESELMRKLAALEAELGVKNKQIESDRVAREEAERKRLAQDSARKLEERRKEAERDAVAKREAKKTESIKKPQSIANQSNGTVGNSQLNTVRNQTQRQVAPIDQARTLSPTATAVKNPHETYTAMEPDKLIHEVKRFMDSQNIKSSMIEKSKLEAKFGKANIDRLLAKSYLIRTPKGITAGRM